MPKAAPNLRRARAEPERFSKSVPEADVDEPGLAEIDAQAQVIELGTEAAFSKHPRREQGDLKAELCKQPGEETVELVAEATASADYDLVVKRSWLEHDLPPQADVEIFKGYGVEVGPLERRQRTSRHVDRSAVADPFKVVLNLHNQKFYPIPFLFGCL